MKTLLLDLCFCALGFVLYALWKPRTRQPVLLVCSDAAGQWWWQVKRGVEAERMVGPFDTRLEAFNAGRLAVFGKLKGEA